MHNVDCRVTTNVKIMRTACGIEVGLLWFTTKEMNFHKGPLLMSSYHITPPLPIIKQKHFREPPPPSMMT